MSKVFLSQLPQFAQEVLARVSPASRAFLVCLQGDLGAGKTTFVQLLARGLGVIETVQSPTFVLMRTHPISWNGFNKLVHIDAYRLEKPEEFQALKPEEFLNDKRALVCVEWPEKIEGVLPKPHLVLRFGVRKEKEARDIEIKGEK